MTHSNSGIEATDILRGVDVFRDLSEEHLARIATFTVCENVAEDVVMFREGDSQEFIYLIDSGNVALEIKVPGQGAHRIHTVSAGELLGWTPALGAAYMTATARTLTPTRACRINAKQVLEFCDHNPQFGYEFMRRTALAISKRLTATRLQLLDVYRIELPRANNPEEVEQ
jgi:CRP-like cAMP-binding protein